MSSEDYGNCPECDADFDRIFRIDTRMQEYYDKGLPLHCFTYLCGSVSVCNQPAPEGPITNLKFRRQSNACKIIKELRIKEAKLQWIANELGSLELHEADDVMELSHSTDGCKWIEDFMIMRILDKLENDND